MEIAPDCGNQSPFSKILSKRRENDELAITHGFEVAFTSSIKISTQLTAAGNLQNMRLRFGCVGSKARANHVSQSIAFGVTNLRVSYARHV